MAQINRYKIDYEEFKKYCGILSNKIKISGKEYKYIYPIPKNGLYVANEINKIIHIPVEVDYDRVKEFNKNEILIVDDIIDSGRTLDKYYGYDKAVLFVKNNNSDKINYYVKDIEEWIQFYFEKDNDIEDNLVRILEYLGENPNREGLKDTPKRIIKSWEKLFGGYRQDIKDILTSFEDDRCDEMIILKNIEFYSTCEHHFLPFFGKCHIAYIPDKKIIGVSKLARILEMYARRLQIQERLTKQIADCIEDGLQAKGVMVIIEAQHFCMTSRGIEKQQSRMVTSAIRGSFNHSEVRNEFLNLIR